MRRSLPSSGKKKLILSLLPLIWKDENRNIQGDNQMLASINLLLAICDEFQRDSICFHCTPVTHSLTPPSVLASIGLKNARNTALRLVFHPACMHGSRLRKPSCGRAARRATLIFQDSRPLIVLRRNRPSERAQRVFSKGTLSSFNACWLTIVGDRFPSYT